MPKPSQRDIAERAQVSQTAVSLVLNGKAGVSVSAATQARIRRAMAELNYVPDAVARSLRGGRNDLIGVHTYESVFPVGPGDYFHDFLVGIEERAAELGRDLVLFASTQRPDGRRSIYGASGNRLRLADGTVVIGLERDDDELRRLSAEHYPFVVLGRRDSLPEAASVGVDYAPAVEHVVSLLAEAGHRHLAYLRGRKDETPQRDRRTAFSRHVAALGLVEHWYDRADTTESTGPARWVADGITAVVVESPEDAPHVAELAAATGVTVPDQLSAVCLDAVPAGSPTSSWSQLHIPKRAIGARTLTVLTEILDGRLPIDHQELQPCSSDVSLSTIAPPDRR
ncbi:LacI family DNA-binding transcriptional regulator [Auraticoccus sp. F435]|uniref:LacI family DNA-binding transcriptional regulator n=1 Tax=Auraticoccus cholistanensis TaxID=2656650 RepID=A0A6A9V0A4_9ACTN|nr:LacI family DNA-binding transcriptional regulator [Auraticoccus cholistanensis]MVA75070.1 LacI family DNA-binding transcriptional regulator [Auraticoccus cholistanensis]